MTSVVATPLEEQTEDRTVKLKSAGRAAFAAGGRARTLEEGASSLPGRAGHTGLGPYASASCLCCPDHC